MALDKNVAKGIKTRQENELLENNKLIAEFMGDISSMNAKVSFSKNCGVNDLQYHTSWDWLMPVVESIFERLDLRDDSANEIKKGMLVCSRNNTYKAVVEFINEYNIKKED